MENIDQAKSSIKELIAHIRHERCSMKDGLKVTNGYYSNKAAIRKVFDKTKSTCREDILARLALIDSMYSTQMTKRYYGLEELADALYLVTISCVDNGKSSNVLKQKFLQLLRDNDTSAYELFEYNKNLSIDSNGVSDQIVNLFEEKYGLDKDGNDKGVALSLITKYAYFETCYKFPIYDSIVKEMYPLLWRYCNLKGECPNIDDNIVSFIKAICLLRKKLSSFCGTFSYDDLDCLLWTTGKIMRGNMSLVFSMKQYREFGKDFNIRLWSRSQIDTRFKNDKYLLPFLQFAKELTYYEVVEWKAGKSLKTIIEEFAQKYLIDIKVISPEENVFSKTLNQLSKPPKSIVPSVIDSSFQIMQVRDYFEQIPLQVKFYKKHDKTEDNKEYNQELPAELKIQDYMNGIE